MSRSLAASTSILGCITGGDAPHTGRPNAAAVGAAGPDEQPDIVAAQLTRPAIDDRGPSSGEGPVRRDRTGGAGGGRPDNAYVPAQRPTSAGRRGASQRRFGVASAG